MLVRRRWTCLCVCACWLPLWLPHLDGRPPYPIYRTDRGRSTRQAVDAANDADDRSAEVCSVLEEAIGEHTWVPTSNWQRLNWSLYGDPKNKRLATSLFAI